MKLLILGGYGVFGGRLAELLSDISEIEIIIAGRNLPKATAFSAGRVWNARIKPLQLDRSDLALALSTEAPDLVVDASGPFQDYGDNRYSVIKDCISAKVNYLDFADAADFVFNVGRFDNEARAAGIFVLSGVSSFPVLTAAVLRRMAETMEIVSVEGGIAPSPYAGIGLNVMRAVVGYAGGSVKILRNGEQVQAVGLAESMRFTIAVPGRLPLKNIHFSLVDVPDLQVIPPQFETLKDIWIGAGPVPEALHRVLNLFAKARAKFRLPSLVPLSGLFFRILNLMKYGEHRGGMFIRARGLRGDEKVEQSWHLLAEGDDGPYIPSMAIEAIIRKTLSGSPPAIGARPATHALELSDYEHLFAGRSIFSGMRHPEPPSAQLYQKILGSSFDRLPDQVKALHGVTQTQRWIGHSQVRRGKKLGARAIAGIIGFPNTADKVSVSVTLSHHGDGERWTREFGGKTFASFQECGTGKNDYLLVERFGIVSVALALVVEEDRLLFVPRRWSCFGLPLPGVLLPKGETFETEADGKFCFNVEIMAPIFGLIVAYKGELEPAG
ncbi:MAG: DUF4166 domain-containing protein [Boseongicola sp.]